MNMEDKKSNKSEVGFNQFYKGKKLDEEFMKYSEGRFFRLINKCCYGHEMKLKLLTEEDRNEFKFDKDKEIPITYFPNKEGKNLIIRDIPFKSLCEHHFMPMDGQIYIGYIPNKKLLGLNKIDRIAKYFCARLQQQERIAKNIADWFMEHVEPLGVMVVVKGKHYCAIMQDDEGDFITSAIRGVFAHPPEGQNPRDEMLRLMKWN